MTVPETRLITGEDARVYLDQMVNDLKAGTPIEAVGGQYSFIKLLKKYLLLKNPQRILEWGPGISTVLMATLLPNSEIVTLEHEMEWFLYWNNHYLCFPKIRMFPLKVEGNYVEAPLAMGKFDLVFVDGKDDYRAPCLEVAAQVLNAGGVVLVHDAERVYYWPPIREHFTVLETDVNEWDSQTVALELKKQ